MLFENSSAFTFLPWLGTCDGLLPAGCILGGTYFAAGPLRLVNDGLKLTN
jgi:hypothetical protein